MTIMGGKGITRRGLLAVVPSAAFAIAVDCSARAEPFPDAAAPRFLTVFRDFTALRLAPSRMVAVWRSRPSIEAPRTIVLSDASPSMFAAHRNAVLLRPGALLALPIPVVAVLVRGGGPLVISAPAIDGGAPGAGPALWSRLAELLAAPDMPVTAWMDLGGSNSGDEALRAGIAAFRQAFAMRSRGTVSIACPDGSTACGG